MEETVLTHLLSNVGIPAAMAFYVLFGVNKTLNKQNDTLQKLTDAINNLTSDVDKRISKLEDRVDFFTREIQHNDNIQH